MVAYTKPHQRKKEGERDQIKFIDLRFERWHIEDSGKQEEGKMFRKMHVLGVNDDLWDTVRRSGSEIWKRCKIE